MSQRLNQMYSTREAYRLPLYTLRQAAHLTGLANATVRSWTQTADTGLIQPAAAGGLSFLNLVELHVLASIRKHHQLSLPKIRYAVQYVRRELKTEHPLAEQQFETDGADLFIRALDDTLVNASKHGQVAIRELMNAYLQRIQRAPDGFPLRLFPVYRHDVDTVQEVQQAPSFIVVDPAIAFGRPILAENSIPVDVVVGRYKAGDSISELVEDYDLSYQAVEEALRFELGNAA